MLKLYGYVSSDNHEKVMIAMKEREMRVFLLQNDE